MTNFRASFVHKIRSILRLLLLIVVIFTFFFFVILLSHFVVLNIVVQRYAKAQQPVLIAETHQRNGVTNVYCCTGTLRRLMSMILQIFKSNYLFHSFEIRAKLHSMRYTGSLGLYEILNQNWNRTENNWFWNGNITKNPCLTFILKPKPKL